MDEQRWLTCEMFTGHVGEAFEVVADGGPVTVELVEATEGEAPGGTGPDGARRRQFSLVFRGPAAPRLEQSIHRLHHAALGTVELFLVPVGQGADGVQYEAAFS